MPPPSAADLAEHDIYLHQSLLSPSDAARIIALTEDELSSSRSSSATGSQPSDYAQQTHDFEVCKSPVLRSFILSTGLIPLVSDLISGHYSRPISCFDDVFVVKYSLEQQRSLVSHFDAASVSFMVSKNVPAWPTKQASIVLSNGQPILVPPKTTFISLSPPPPPPQVALSPESSFAGGGTRFACLPSGRDVVKCSVGDCLLFPASLYHAGLPITAGVRYLLVGFSWQSNEALKNRGNVSRDYLSELRGFESRFDVMSFEGQDDALSRLRKDVELRMEENKTYFVEYSGGGTGGGEKRLEEASGIVEAFVRSVIDQHKARLNLKKVAGGEFWFSNASEGMPLHYDKDEVEFRDGGIMRRPLLATVTYLAEGVEVPPTVVFGEDESIVSYPKLGNHICFHGSLLHGVCEELTRGGDNEGDRRKRRKKARFTLMLNLWKESPRLDDMSTLKRVGDDRKGSEDKFSLDFAPFSEVDCKRSTVYCPGGDVDNFEVDPEAFVKDDLKGLLKEKGILDERRGSSVFVLVPESA